MNIEAAMGIQVNAQTEKSEYLDSTTKSVKNMYFNMYFNTQ